MIRSSRSRAIRYRSGVRWGLVAVMVATDADGETFKLVLRYVQDGSIQIWALERR